MSCQCLLAAPPHPHPWPPWLLEAHWPLPAFQPLLELLVCLGSPPLPPVVPLAPITRLSSDAFLSWPLHCLLQPLFLTPLTWSLHPSCTQQTPLRAQETGLRSSGSAPGEGKVGEMLHSGEVKEGRGGRRDRSKIGLPRGTQTTMRQGELCSPGNNNDTQPTCVTGCSCLGQALCCLTPLSHPHVCTNKLRFREAKALAQGHTEVRLGPKGGLSVQHMHSEWPSLLSSKAGRVMEKRTEEQGDFKS